MGKCAPSAGAAIVTAGGVLSIFTAGERTDAVLPARSVAVTVPVTAEASSESTSGLVVLPPASTPAPMSSIVNGIDTSVLFQPAVFGPGVGVSNATLGGCASMSQEKAWAAALPAPSV